MVLSHPVNGRYDEKRKRQMITFVSDIDLQPFKKGKASKVHLKEAALVKFVAIYNGEDILVLVYPTNVFGGMKHSHAAGWMLRKNTGLEFLGAGLINNDGMARFQSSSCEDDFGFDTPPDGGEELLREIKAFWDDLMSY